MIFWSPRLSNLVVAGPQETSYTVINKPTVVVDLPGSRETPNDGAKPLSKKEASPVLMNRVCVTLSMIA